MIVTNDFVLSAFAPAGATLKVEPAKPLDVVALLVGVGRAELYVNSQLAAQVLPQFLFKNKVAVVEGEPMGRFLAKGEKLVVVEVRLKQPVGRIARVNGVEDEVSAVVSFYVVEILDVPAVETDPSTANELESESEEA